jgi:flagellar biosynthesis/type III secretory pathway protein FliH
MDDSPVEDPQNETSGSGKLRRVLVAVLVLLLLGGLGAGGYFYGKSTGEDLDAARAEGAAAGQRKGAAKGAEEGYAEGFAEGRKKGYEQTYDDAYRAAYTKAFEDAGLDPPTKIKVEGG